MSRVSTDPIADMLTRIRNAIMVNKTDVSMPHSQLKETVAKVLVNNGFLKDAKMEEEGGRRTLRITIAPENGNATITEIDRLSRPGQRRYVRADNIPVVKRGRGIVIISTSSGVMTGEEAKTKRLGGELICQVY